MAAPGRMTRRATGAALPLLLCLSLLSCGRHSPGSWAAEVWDGAGAAGAAVATLDWATLPGVVVSIDGIPVGAGFKAATLAPGRHVVEYAHYPAAFGEHPKGTFQVDLAARHAYEFRIKLCFWCHPRTYAVWVEDMATGELAWGARNDWPSWWL